jgi:L-seryl-tRNA(Ser) seleniumtransferase
MSDQAPGNASVYDRLGVRPIINACGPATRLSGGVMRPEVARAMAEAAQSCVDIAALQAAAGREIAEITGAEAGFVTAGAAAGLMLGAAACVTGLDPAKVNRLPDTTGMKNECVVARSQRNMYDHAVAQAGLRLVEVGIPDRYAGAGVRDAQAWEYAAAIGERTALVLWVADANAEPPLAEVVRVAHARGVPVLVDAAAQLPPVDNLRRFVAEGADLVAFSGGKAIGGPQASGILAGRRALIQAAALNQLDHDIGFAEWDPPPALFDKARMTGLPASGIGRAAKIGKEQIVGLIVALRLFVAEDAAARRAAWLARCEELARALDGIAGTAVRIVDGAVPMVELAVDAAARGCSAAQLARRLQAGDPPVAVSHRKLRQGIVLMGPTCLKPGEPALVGGAVRAALGCR